MAPPLTTPAHAAPTHDPHAHEKHAAAPLTAAVRIVSGLTLLSRFAGLARDIVTARIFGATALGSAFQAAYALPNLFRRLFGEGALSAAFLPEYTLLKRDDPERAAQLASVTIWMLTLVTGLITLAGEALFLLGLWLLPHDAERATSIRLMMLMLPMMPAVCITAVLGGVLQAHGRFGPPAAAPIILNLFQIGAGLAFYRWLAPEPTAYIVGGAAVLASGVQIAWSLAALRGRVRWTRGWEAARPHARRVFQRFLPAMLGLGTLQVNTMLDTVIAMWPVWVGPTMLGYAVTLDDQSNAILRYTQTFYQFPLGVFGIAVGTAVFPLLARSADQPHQFVQHLRRGLRLSFFIGLPGSIGLFLVRHDLLAAIYGGGRSGFEADDLARAAAVLAGFAPAVWAYSLNHVFTRAFYARGDTATPMRLAMAIVALNLTLNLTLIWPLREAGLAWATAISAIIQCLVLGWLCVRRLDAHPFDRTTRIALMRIGLAGVLMGGVVVLIQVLWPAPERWAGHVARAAVTTAAGGIAYAAIARLLRLAELMWLLHRGEAPVEGAEGMSLE